MQLKVTDPHGLFDTDSVVISAGNTPPSANIVYPNPPMSWEVGQRFTFQGTADDQQDGALPPSAFSWSLLLQHCSAAGSGCHTHSLQTFSGSPSGSFIPPDHDWPSRLELRLTVTDSGGLQDTRTSVLDPVTTVLVFDSNPRGMQLTVGSESSSTPFARRVIVGSRNSVSAPGQTRAGTPYGFTSWSDGKPQSHDVIATQSWTYTATFTADAERPGPPSGLVAAAAGPAQVDLSWTAATDNVGVTNYNVYRDGVLLTTTGPSPSFSDTTAAAGTTYSYRVTARDAAGNESDPSNAASATTPAAVPVTRTFAPEADARVEEPNPNTNFGTQTSLRAEGGLDPDIESFLRFRVTGVTGPLQSAKLRLWVTDATADGPAVYTTGNSWAETGITWDNRPGRTSGPVDDKGALPTGAWVEYDVRPLVGADGTYSFVLATSHVDAINFRARETTIAAERPQLVVSFLPGPSDFLRPGAPPGLGVSTTASGRIDLSWTPATDNVGVTNYRIYRDGGVLATPGPVTSFYDTTAARGTDYTYRVTAMDAAGNESDLSPAVTLTTPNLVTRAFEPAADARVEEANPTLNLGADGRLKVEGGLDPDIDSYLRFRATGISGPLQSAKLRLWITEGTAKDRLSTRPPTTPGPRTPSHGRTSPHGDSGPTTTRPRSRWGPGSSGTSSPS